ncbi:hypothetical protein EKO27_g5355 [Xylaria grammica]|uniref:Alpha-type protein kinase domain-containing protein n=1 Tax=Xylaria grammica TaxID=363999 RepID=A0A439D5T8_9PEZI|nr:hypothetical protein EKO27_g5355 [Xylaria grammica]
MDTQAFIIPNSRKNNATRASIFLNHAFASGTFKNVYVGRYTAGERAGERCVAKEFKTGSVFQEHYFNEEMSVIRRTQEVIDDWWNAGIIGRRIFLNTPAVWTYEVSGKKALVEPIIENFEKLNSNSGWVNLVGGAWGEVMQALSHFSYHNSAGQILLCDLQGGPCSDGYILSDPAILSQTIRAYGPADLGPDGIYSFFRRHRCGSFCKRWWRTPTSQGVARFPMTRGTTMVPNPPARVRYNPLARIPK